MNRVPSAVSLATSTGTPARANDSIAQRPPLADRALDRNGTGLDARARALMAGADSASLSLSYDGKRISSDQIMDTLNRKLAARGLGISLLKAMD